jgi:putative selenate reductase
VFCPEDGGPYVLKPRFFGSEASWGRAPKGDGFFLSKEGVARGRFQGHEFQLIASGESSRFSGQGFELELDESKPDAPLSAKVDAGVEVDLTYFHILKWMRDSIRAMPLNYVNA